MTTFLKHRMIKVITNPKCTIKRVLKCLFIWNYYDLTKTRYKTHYSKLYVGVELVSLFYIFNGLLFIIYNPFESVKGLYGLPYLIQFEKFMGSKLKKD